MILLTQTAANSQAPAAAGAGNESKKGPSISAMIEAKNYEQALNECRSTGAEADKESRKAVYDNYALLLEKGVIKDLDHIANFYLKFENEEAGANLQPLFLIITHLGAKQKNKEAVLLLDKLNVIFPSNAFYISAAPIVFSKAGRFDDAHKILKAEFEKKPDADTEKMLKVQLIEVFLNAGKIDEALKTLQEEIAKYPGDAFYKDYLTTISQRTGAYDKTMPLIQQNIKNYSTDESSLKSLFYQSMKKDNFETALAAFEKIAQEKPDDIAVNTMVAELNVISGNHETAAVLIEKLLKSVPENTRAHWLKGRLLFDTQKYDQAYSYLKKYIDAFKDAVEMKTHYYLALSCIKTGRMSEAVFYMNVELEKSPANNSKLLLREMEAAFYREKMFNTAINFFGDLAKKFPADSELLSKISLFHYYAGEYKEAIEYGNKAVSGGSDTFSAAYILAMAYSKLGDNKRALELFKLCAEKSPSVSSDAFNAAVQQSSSLIWPFAHQYLCYIHSAMRCGEMSKVTGGLNDLFAFLADKTPPKFVAKDIKSINPFAVRPEYSLFESFEFFLKNSLTEEYYKNLESKGEASALVNFYVKDPKVLELYEKSLNAQFKGDIQGSLAYTMEALKIDPDNIFLTVRAASAGIAVNSPLMMPLSLKILTYQLPASAADEQKAMKCCISAFKLGAKNAIKNNIANIGAIKKSLGDLSENEYKNTDSEGMKEFEADVEVLKKTKFNKMALMMESTLYYFKGDVNKSKVPVFEYIKQEPDLSTFIWFVTNIGGYFII
jgi:tetratricopeptide (TPR) repeat protein